ncbi:hypothetical protein ABPG72_017935 [Tetrahymena utriculariae]
MEEYIKKVTINEPKTKSINYNFQNMKFFIYSTIIGMEGLEFYQEKGGYCTQEGYELMKMIYHSSYLMFIINTLFLAYAYIRLRFVRFSFYLNYIVNFIYNLVIIIICMNVAVSQPKECLSVIMVQKSIIFLTIKKEIEIWTVLKMPLDMASRQANLSSNFLFPYLILSSGNLDDCSKIQSQRIRFLMLFGHTLVSLFGTAMNFLLHFLQTKYQMKLRGGFKFTIIICTVCMLLIYIVIVEYDGPKSIQSRQLQCQPLQYTLQIYSKINVISIFSMVLLYFFEDEDLIIQIKNFFFSAYEQLTQKPNTVNQENVLNTSFQSQSSPSQKLQQKEYYDTEFNINQYGYNTQDYLDKFYIPKGILSAREQIPYLKAFTTEVIGTNSENDNIFSKRSLQQTYGTLQDSPQKSNKQQSIKPNTSSKFLQ